MNIPKIYLLSRNISDSDVAQIKTSSAQPTLHLRPAQNKATAEIYFRIEARKTINKATGKNENRKFNVMHTKMQQISFDDKSHNMCSEYITISDI